MLLCIAASDGFGQEGTTDDLSELAELTTALEKSGVKMSKTGIKAYLLHFTDSTLHKNLIRQLGSDKYVERQAAQKILFRLPKAPIELLKHATNSPDLEVSLRAKQILKVGRPGKRFDHTQTVVNAMRAISVLKFPGLTEEIAATVALFPNKKKIILAAENAMLAIVSKNDISFLSLQINPKSYDPLQTLSVRALRHLKEPKLAKQFQKWASDEELGECARVESALALADFDDRRSLDFYSTFARLAKTHFQERRNSDKALEIREGMLALRVKFLGSEHRQTLDAMIELAMSYGYTRSRIKQTLMIRREIVRLALKLYGPKHRVTLLAMMNLGGTCQNAAKRKDIPELHVRANRLREEGVEMYEKAAKGYRESRGLKSTRTLEIMERLASCYARDGKKEESLALRKKILSARMSFDGPKHPKTLAAMKAVAESYQGLIKMRGGSVRIENGCVVSISFAGMQPKDDDLAIIAEFPDIERLDFFKSSLDDAGLVHLKGLTNLKSLAMGSTKITDAGLVHLRDMTQLDYLGLRACNITDAGIVHLRKMTNLSGLFLAETKVTDAGLIHIQHLKSLDRLYLDTMNVSDAGLIYLKKMANLKYISVYETGITESGVRKLRAWFPKCKIDTEE